MRDDNKLREFWNLEKTTRGADGLATIHAPSKGNKTTTLRHLVTHLDHT